MLFEIILVLVSYYYLKQGIYPLLTGKPAVKADAARRTVVSLVVIQLIFILLGTFVALVALYGYSNHGVTIDEMPFYALLFLFCVLLLWVFYRFENDTDALKQSVALVAVDPDQTMTVVRDTLDEMNLAYQDYMSGFYVEMLDVTVPVKMTGKCIRFNVERPLDKIFLNQFCRNFQQLYAEKQIPLASRFACLSLGIGLGVLVLAVINMIEYLQVFANVFSSIIDLTMA
ncbi:MAG: hypothetical protein K0U68_00020 [Gammaproteobacteria bacterium]|nr:hypothetical protein [Gammaproteobacteria bacterium]